MSIVFSSIQPTGQGLPHLGNYLSAFKGYVALQKTSKAFYCIADQHTITKAYDPKTLSLACRTTTAALVACGIEPSKAILFRQSGVPHHSMLAQVLLQILPSLEHLPPSKHDRLPVGQRLSPVLMAADILLYKASHVLVGHDKHHHVQFAQYLANRFHEVTQSSCFTIPTATFFGPERPIMSLQQPLEKMSKAQEIGTVWLTDTSAALAHKLQQAVQDGDRVEVETLDQTPALRNLLHMLAGLSDRSFQDICVQYQGQSRSLVQDALIAAFEETIVPIGQRLQALLTEDHNNPRSHLKMVLEHGAARARNIAQPTIEEIYALMGFS